MWIKRNLPSFAIIGIMLVFSYFYYGSLPDTIPTHFDFHGNPDRYSSKKFFIVLMPVIFSIVLVITNILVYISPKIFSMAHSKKALDRIIFGTGLLFLGIHLGSMLDPGPMEVNGLSTRIFTAGMACFLIVAGNMLGKSERNFFVGFRIPWTIASEANWKATHRFAARMMVGWGVLLVIIIPVYSQVALATVGLILILLISCGYSFWYYLKKERPYEE